MADFHRRMKKRTAKRRGDHTTIAHLRAGDEQWNRGCEICDARPSIYRPGQPLLCRGCSHKETK